MADHKMVQQMFRQAERAKEKPDQLREIVEAACAALTLHAEIEEQHFYPQMRQTGKDTDMIAEAYVEHASAKQLIAELEGGDPEDEEYAAKFKVLGEYVKHHVKEEENEIFPKARRARADFEPLLEALIARDEAVMAEGSREDSAGLNSGRGRAGTRSGSATASQSGRGGSQSSRSGSQGARGGSQGSGSGSQSSRSGATGGGRGSRSAGDEDSDTTRAEGRAGTRGRQGRGSGISSGAAADSTGEEGGDASMADIEQPRRGRRGGQDVTTDAETGARGRDSESEEQESGSTRQGR
jgi:hemerythrin-like domain-containing protein